MGVDAGTQVNSGHRSTGLAVDSDADSCEAAGVSAAAASPRGAIGEASVRPATQTRAPTGATDATLAASAVSSWVGSLAELPPRARLEWTRTIKADEIAQAAAQVAAADRRGGGGRLRSHMDEVARGLRGGGGGGATLADRLLLQAGVWPPYRFHYHHTAAGDEAAGGEAADGEAAGGEAAGGEAAGGEAADGEVAEAAPGSTAIAAYIAALMTEAAHDKGITLRRRRVEHSDGGASGPAGVTHGELAAMLAEAGGSGPAAASLPTAFVPVLARYLQRRAATDPTMRAEAAVVLASASSDGAASATPTVPPLHWALQLASDEAQAAAAAAWLRARAALATDVDRPSAALASGGPASATTDGDDAMLESLMDDLLSDD